MELKRRATRAELFEQDEYAPNWHDHQQWRINRIMAKRGAQLSVPVKDLRLCYEDKLLLELYDRTGRRQQYRPHGVVLNQLGPDNAMDMFEFEVAWVDPWGYAHTATRSFLDIRLVPETQMEHMRQMREYRQAVGKHWITPVLQEQE